MEFEGFETIKDLPTGDQRFYELNPEKLEHLFYFAWLMRFITNRNFNLYYRFSDKKLFFELF